jgi:hypothetical protein
MLFLFGCSQTDDEILQGQISEVMGWLYSAEPAQDYHSAISRKDYRFIGVNGYSSYVPGVNPTCILNDSDVRLIAGTSDAVLNYEHAKLIAIAQVYANEYNIHMLTYRKEHLGLKCDS